MYLDLNDLAHELEELEALEFKLHQAETTLDDTEGHRLNELQALETDLGGSLDDYARGATDLILESEFEDYAQELAESLGYIDANEPLVMFVDWERWADDLKQHYSSVQFDGDTYFIRMY